MVTYGSVVCLQTLFRMEAIMVARTDNHRASGLTDEDFARRRAKLVEYVNEAEMTMSALEANLAIVNSDFMVVMMYLRSDLEELRASIFDPKQRKDLLLEISEQMYKTAKQINFLT